MLEKGIDRILELAAAAGFECEVYGEAARSLRIEVHRGEIESMERSRDSGIGMRLVRSGRVGHSSSSDLSPSGLDAAFEEARVNASSSLPMGVDVLADYRHMEVGGIAYPKLPREWEEGPKVEGVREMEQACYAYSPAVVNTEGAGYHEIVRDVIVAGSRGFSRREKRGSCMCSVSAVARGGDEVRSGWYFAQALDPQDIDFRGVGRIAAGRAVNLLGFERMASKRYPVILDGSVFTDIIGMLEQALSAETVVKGTSVLAGKLGEVVAPEIVSIVDDPFMEGGCFNASFDAEGLPKQKCVLIESGVLEGYLHNAYSSRKMDARPTANAVRDSFKSLPVPGGTNLYLHPGKVGLDEMISGLEEGIYVQDMMGMHTADTISGDFSAGISGCYIRPGAAARPICEMTLSGNILDLLRGILKIGNELIFIGPYGSPAVLVEGLSVSGR